MSNNKIDTEKVTEDITEILTYLEELTTAKDKMDSMCNEIIENCDTLSGYGGQKISDSYRTYDEYNQSTDQWSIVTKCDVCNNNASAGTIKTIATNLQTYLEEIPVILTEMIANLSQDKEIISNIEEQIEKLKKALGAEFYSVQSGDTLIKIASMYGLTYQELAEYNKIEDPNNIKIDQIIRIPIKELEDTSKEEKTKSKDIEYSVQSGDTLIKIASMYGLTYQELAEYNNIEDPNNIDVDKILKIPNQTIEEETEKQEITTPVNSQEIITYLTENKQIDTSNIDPNSNVGKALQKYGTNFDEDTYVTVKDNMYMTIKDETIDGNKCQVTHIVINDGSQVNGEPANGEYASGLETTSSASQRVGATLAINGSHFDYADGSEDLAGANNIVIVNGEIKTNGSAGGMEICLDNNGNFFTATPGTSAQELVDSGVKYTFSSHDSHLIENGNITYEHQDSSYNSTVIGMVEPCDYYIVTGSTTNFGVSEYLSDQGCSWAKSMDQGGSVSLVKDGELLNNPTDGTERAVGDFLYFT